MKKILFPIALLCTLSVNAQNWQISFAGTGAAATVTAVKVENLTQCLSLNLNEGDILNLTGTVGINDLTIDADNNVIIYPNPMKGTCSIDFEAPAKGKTTVALYNMAGKRILYMQELLSKGHHTYSLSGINSGIYILKIESDRYSYNAKIVCNNLSTGNAEIKHVGLTSGINKQNTSSNAEKSMSMKGNESLIDMQYNTGDILKLTGKSGIYKTVFMLVPTQSQTVTFNFIACTDGDDNNYSIVQIGTQVWTVENMKTTKYANGTSIPNVTDNTSWINLTTGAYCEYNNTSGNGITYGKLYNAYAVEDSRKLCPIGWHVSTDEEWSTLTNYLGGWEDVGGKLREACSTLWHSPNTGATNETGFTALPGGARAWDDGTFFGIIDTNYFWTSTAADSPGTDWGRLLYSFSSNVYRGRYHRVEGFYVRCVKDN